MTKYLKKSPGLNWHASTLINVLNNEEIRKERKNVIKER